MGKLALCINTRAAPNDYLDTLADNQEYCVIDTPHNFFENLETHLVDRDICETDENTLQLLPYNVLIHPDSRVYFYYRGGAGEESRLHGKISIGVGGHVDRAPTDSDLLALLREEAARELKEEVNLTIDGGWLDYEYLIADPTNAVGRVHMGLVGVYYMNATEVATMTPESGTIENGGFMTWAELRKPETFDRLENWSKALVEFQEMTGSIADDPAFDNHALESDEDDSDDGLDSSPAVDAFDNVLSQVRVVDVTPRQASATTNDGNQFDASVQDDQPDDTTADLSGGFQREQVQAVSSTDARDTGSTYSLPDTDSSSSSASDSSDSSSSYSND